MKKLHLLLIALMLSLASLAQTRLTSPQAGSISVQNPNESFVATYPVDKLFFTLGNNVVRLYLVSGAGPGSTNIVANNAPNQYLLNGASGTDTATVKAYLVGLGVGKAPSGGGGGGGGGGDASAANQQTQIARETSIRDAIGSQADAAATSDGGTFSLISLFKRSLSYLTNLTGIATTNATTATNTTTIATNTGNTASNTSTIATNTGNDATNTAAINAKTKPLVARTSTAVTVGTSSTALTSANASGYRVFIQNNGANDIWISIGGTATLAAPSIRIIAGGSYMTSSEYPDTQAITAIATASQTITVMTY